MKGRRYRRQRKLANKLERVRLREERAAAERAAWRLAADPNYPIDGSDGLSPAYDAGDNLHPKPGDIRRFAVSGGTIP